MPVSLPDILAECSLGGQPAQELSHNDPSEQSEPMFAGRDDPDHIIRMKPRELLASGVVHILPGLERGRSVPTPVHDVVSHQRTPIKKLVPVMLPDLARVPGENTLEFAVAHLPIQGLGVELDDVCRVDRFVLRQWYVLLLGAKRGDALDA